jgi:protein-S-isoprenylcysteine O-methyltransferase Ste14
LTKNFAWPEAQKIVIAVVISNVVGFVVSLLATLAGTWNAVGWLSVGLYLVFGLVFAYFLFIKKSV